MSKLLLLSTLFLLHVLSLGLTNNQVNTTIGGSIKQYRRYLRPREREEKDNPREREENGQCSFTFKRDVPDWNMLELPEAYRGSVEMERAIFSSQRFPRSVDGVRNMILPEDVREGQYDPWFLASIAALAQDQARIQNFFFSTPYFSEPESLFTFTFYERNHPILISIDDLLPTIEGTDERYDDFGIKRPFNAWPSKTGGWWAPLMEKAYAVFSQGEPSQPGVAFRELTNMPVEVFNITYMNIYELFGLIHKYDQTNWPMVAQSKKYFSGIQAGEVFSILGDVLLTEGPKLLKLRSSNGRLSYYGPFGYDDPQWTEEWKREAGINRRTEKNGIFYMTDVDFQNTFETVAVAYYQDWNTDQYEVEGRGRKFGPYIVSSKANQDLIITFESAQISSGCTINYDFKMRINGGAFINVKNKYGFGIHKMYASEGQRIEVFIQNEGQWDEISNFVLTAYGAQAEVEWFPARRRAQEAGKRRRPISKRNTIKRVARRRD